MIAIVVLAGISIMLHHRPFFLVVGIIKSNLLASLVIIIQYCCLYSLCCALAILGLFTIVCKFVSLNNICTDPSDSLPLVTTILFSFLQVRLFKIPHISNIETVYGRGPRNRKIPGDVKLLFCTCSCSRLATISITFLGWRK